MRQRRHDSERSGEACDLFQIVICFIIHDLIITIINFGLLTSFESVVPSLTLWYEVNQLIV